MTHKSVLDVSFLNSIEAMLQETLEQMQQQEEWLQNLHKPESQEPSSEADLLDQLHQRLDHWQQQAGQLAQHIEAAERHLDEQQQHLEEWSEAIRLARKQIPRIESNLVAPESSA